MFYHLNVVSDHLHKKNIPGQVEFSVRREERKFLVKGREEQNKEVKEERR